MLRALLPVTLVVFVCLVTAAGHAEVRRMDSPKKGKTLRLLMPQWQGGDYDIKPSSGEIYPMGARLLAFLAPESEAPLVEVPVEAYTGAPRPSQNGVVWQDVVLRQLRAARTIIDEHAPDRIIMFGGDCLVDQAPFAYLNERYQGRLGLLWIDAHPDISTPAMHDREHAMILGNLLGKGDPVFAKEVALPLKPEQVLMIGLDGYNSPEEEKAVNSIGLRALPSADVAENSEAVLKWIKDNKFDHIAIHFDLDVLDPKSFYSQLPMNPNGLPFDTVGSKLTIYQATRLIKDVSAAADLVGLGITEHMPWDALNLKNMMKEFPIMQ